VFTDPIDSNQTVKAMALFKTNYITDEGLNYAPIKIKVNPALKEYSLFLLMVAIAI
jgi:hypothetical protein